MKIPRGGGKVNKREEKEDDLKRTDLTSTKGVP